jgi:hypothetical protein
MLLENGADVDIQDQVTNYFTVLFILHEAGATPLSHVPFCGVPEPLIIALLALLLDHGGNINHVPSVSLSPHRDS